MLFLTLKHVTTTRSYPISSTLVEWNSELSPFDISLTPDYNPSFKQLSKSLIPYMMLFIVFFNICLKFLQTREDPS
jgi:hypothetical protein